MKRIILPLAVSSVLLASCVDTTGLSAELSRPPHPSSNAQSSIVVMEFADLECPACKSAHDTIVKPLFASPLLEQYGSKIRYEFKHFPLRSIHRYALEAAEAAECAADQGKFWEFVDTNYGNQKDLRSDTIRTWAQSIGLDMDLFDRCTKSHIKRSAIIEEYESGRALGATGTPTFFVNGKKTEASIAAIAGALDALLGQAF